MIVETLQSLLNSPMFCKSKRYPAFLEFVVRAGLSEGSETVKERSVGAAIFDRPIDYDTGVDSVVRVAAGEVRRRMAAYFNEHPDAPVRIELPVGSYKAEFHFRPVPVPDAAVKQSETPASIDPSAEGAPGDPPKVRNEQIPSVSKVQELTSAPRDRIKTPLLAVAAVVVAIFGGIGLWHHLHDRARREFWRPMLHDNESALILMGKTTEPAPEMIGQPKIGAPLGVGQRNLVLDDAIAAAQICNVIREYGSDCKMTAAEQVRADDIHGKALIVVGGLDNPLTQRLLASLPYQPQFDTVSQPLSARTLSIFEQTPTGNVPMWSIGYNEPSAEFGRDYAIVARFHSTMTDAMALVVAGLGPPGTNSAGQYVSAPEKLNEILSKAPKGWKGMNFEAILKIDVVEGSAGHVDVIATRFW